MLPAKLVMIYKGYDLTSAAADFTSVPKYGAGALTLHRTALEWFGYDHLTLINLHSLAGGLTVIVMCAALARARPPRWAVAFAAGLLAFTPLLLRDHRSESILVIGCLVLWAAVLLMDFYLDKRRPVDLVGSVAMTALATITRPELLLIAPLLLTAWIWARSPPGTEKPWRSLGCAALCWLLLVTPHAQHVIDSTREQMGSGALPSMSPDLFGHLLRGGVLYGAIFSPSQFPLIALALAV
ncbi:MAG: glycosyltransferase family 39 protein, partial [Myxococcota bacterium]|nr:glycosyltransferase family 39 protein [Myxococcota bacterium]